MRIAICDDDVMCLGEAKAQVEKWLSLSSHSAQVLLFDNGADLIAENKRQPIDIIFLDIIMPVLNGMDTAEKIRIFHDQAKIIFLTSSPEFAVASYQVEASDYLLKPIRHELLSKALYKATQNLQKKPNTIVISAEEGFKKVYLDEIEFIEASHKGSTIYILSGELLRSLTPLYYFEEKLSDKKDFFKCHRSYIVNLLNISSYSQNEVITKGGYRVPIARTVKKYFKEAYLAYYFQ